MEKINYSARQNHKIKNLLDLFLDEELQKEWEKERFSCEQVREWINAGTKSEDCGFVVWLRDVKNLGLEWITNYKEDYQELSERFKKYGLCQECNQPNTGEEWCKDCNSKHFQKNFSNWTSNNSTIDKFIQEHQLKAIETEKLLEWIPYEQFEIEKDENGNNKVVGEGGFGKVYKAKWTKGAIYKWDKWSKKWERRGDEKKQDEEKKKQHYENKKEYEKHKTIVLKSLSKTQNITQEFLREVANHKIIDDWFESIVPCYGISQDPQTGNYLMVMEYVKGGNLRKYLQKNCHNLNFESKLKRLINIAQGLKDIHQKNLIHRDFHSGNILSNKERCLITDLGLSRTVNSQLKEGEIYGVLPYVAPEVLRGQSYTQASDIYSFGIITWEILSGKPPYHDIEHDIDLILEIHDGKRPKFQIRIPQLLENLIERCWDADPEKRPTANELVKISREWQMEIGNKSGDFYQQYIESEEFNKTLPNEIKFPKCKIHPQVSYISKSINTKLIKEALSSRTTSTDWTNTENLNATKNNETNSYFTKELDFDVGIKNRQDKTENDYQTKEFNFDIETSTSANEMTKRFRSLSMEEANQKETKSVKLDKVLEEQEIQLEPMEIDENSWQDIHLNFSPDLLSQWKSWGFTYLQTQEWINIGLQPTDYDFATWLRNELHLTPTELLNDSSRLEDLREQFNEQLQFHQEQPLK